MARVALRRYWERFGWTRGAPRAFAEVEFCAAAAASTPAAAAASQTLLVRVDLENAPLIDWLAAAAIARRARSGVAALSLYARRARYEEVSGDDYVSPLEQPLTIWVASGSTRFELGGEAFEVPTPALAAFLAEMADRLSVCACAAPPGRRELLLDEYAVAAGSPEDAGRPKRPDAGWPRPPDASRPQPSTGESALVTFRTARQAGGPKRISVEVSLCHTAAQNWDTFAEKWLWAQPPLAGGASRTDDWTKNLLGAEVDAAICVCRRADGTGVVRLRGETETGIDEVEVPVDLARQAIAEVARRIGLGPLAAAWRHWDHSC
jgi:hypothetical protein